MLPKPHGKSYPALVGMSMTQLLKLVKDHHLASLLGVYKRMAKTELVNALRKFEKRVSAVPKKDKARTAPPAPKKPKSAVARTSKTPKAVSMPNITNKPSKRRIAPTLIKSTSAEPFESKGGPKGVTTYNEVVKKIEKKAAAMDASKRGKKLVSNTPVRRSARIKTVNNYRTGRNY